MSRLEELRYGMLLAIPRIASLIDSHLMHIGVFYLQSPSTPLHFAKKAGKYVWTNRQGLVVSEPFQLPLEAGCRH